MAQEGTCHMNTSLIEETYNEMYSAHDHPTYFSGIVYSKLHYTMCSFLRILFIQRQKQHGDSFIAGVEI